MLTNITCSEIHRESGGGIQERNPDKSLKSFPPCYSQLSLLTDCTLLLRILGLEISTALP